ncbi:MAG: TRAP transporter substrate-binding protein DctP [Deltaproteobacteria bacterium]|nr:TRAP transporter substrate-binding protein DctP [Deltaproteobacteria bacterium]
MAEPVELRVGTLSPDGSSGMKILRKGADEIEPRTERRVRMKYFAGGVQGDERDMVRKLNLGQLDGAHLTAVGLSLIDESIRVLELPRLFATAEEFDYVADKLWPVLQKRFEAKGFRLQDRGEVGWVHFVSQSELASLAELKKQKVWLNGDDTIVRALFKRLGVAGVPLSVPEVQPALTTGRINTAYGSPLTAVALQWNTSVKYLSSLPMYYQVGGTVMKLDALKQVSAADQGLITSLSKGMSKTLRKQIRKDNESAKKQMERKGVTITAVPPDMIAGFDKAAMEVWKEMTGKVFTKAELALVLKYRAEYRAKYPAK